MPEKIIEPESCDKCPFFERSTSQDGTIFTCKFYDDRGGSSVGGDKFSFCNVEKIVVYEKEK